MHNLFNTLHGCGKKWTALCQTIKRDHILTSLIKSNSKWIKDFDILIPENIKYTKENTGKALHNIRIIKDSFQHQGKYKIII